MIRNDTDEMVCKADDEAEVSRWVDAITAAIGENARRRESVLEEKAARGEVSRSPTVYACCLDRFFCPGQISWSWKVARGGAGRKEGLVVWNKVEAVGWAFRRS